MSGDIVERLRLYAAAEAIHAPLNGGGFGVMREAADAIESRDAEIERLRAAGDELDQAIFHVSCGGTQEDMRRLFEAHKGWKEARKQ